MLGMCAGWASELQANTPALHQTQCGASVAQPKRVSAGQSPASSARRERRPYGWQSPQGAVLGCDSGKVTNSIQRLTQAIVA